MNPSVSEARRAEALAELFERRFLTWLDAACGPEPSPHLRRLWERALLEPTRAFLDRPGKRFRSRLVGVSWSLCAPDERRMPAHLPHLVEALHAGSLIVDDVQDESAERRGAPSLHRLVGVPLAINTGNLLYIWALELIEATGLSAERQLALHRHAASAMVRCHQGQALDLSVRMCDEPQAAVAQLVHSSTYLKSASLLELAATIGAVGAGASPDRVHVMTMFGRDLGAALQMLDDLSGVVNARRREKAREDLRHSRPTWVWGWLARDLAASDFARLQEHGRRVSAGEDPDPLIDRMAPLVRERGVARVRRHLREAVGELRSALGPSADLAELEREVERLQASYV